MQSLLLNFIDFLETERQKEQATLQILHNANAQTHVLLQQILTILYEGFQQMSDSQNTLSAQGQQLLDEVTKQTDIVTSVQSYVTGLSNQLAAALAQAAAGGATPDQLAALHEVRDRLVANDAALSAILANTAPAPAPVPEPAPAPVPEPAPAPVVSSGEPSQPA